MEVKNYLVKQDGKATLLPKDLEDENGKYEPPKAADIIELPVTFGIRRKMRIALYPEDSVRAIRATDVEHAPGALYPRDLKNLKGKFLPTLLAQALELVGKVNGKDIVVFILLGVSILVGGFDAYLIYKVGHALRIL